MPCTSITDTAGSALAGAAAPLRMAETTLQRMAAGGMWDHLGGGFHRYSVDEHWHVPHFEKVLALAVHASGRSSDSRLP